MSTLQVSNIHFESTGNNRLQYTGSNSYNLVGGGVVVATVNTTSVEFPVGFGVNNFSANTISIGAVLIANSTVVNASHLAGVAGASYQLNSTLAANVAKLTANNTTYLNGQLASFYTNATNITTGTLPYAQIPANVINTTAAFTRTGITTFSANIVLGSSGISANGSYGTTGQVLTSNGSATYWAPTSVNVDATYAWTNNHTWSAAANLVVGAGPYADTRFYVNTYWTTDSSTYNFYVDSRDNNTALTAVRSRYGIYSSLNNRSQNKNVDGITTYNSNYRAVVGDVISGSSSSGGNAFASELIGGNFRAYNYANGSGANGVNNAYGTRNQVFSYGSGTILNGYGTQSQVLIGNATATGNITTAYGVSSEIISNTAATIVTGYLFYGSHEGANTTTKWGTYVTGETKNYFSGNVGIGNTAPTNKLSVNGTTYLGGDLTLINTGALIANGSAGVAGQVLHSNGTAIYWAADDTSGGTVTSVASGSGLTGGPVTTTGTLSVLANSGIIANTTGVFVNATYIGTISSNNASFLGGTAAASYQLNSTLAANVATLTANNASYLNGQLASYYTNATNITTGTLPYAQIPANIINTTAAFTRTGITTFSANVVLGSSGLSANGSFGTAGQVLHSNGSATYWAADDTSGGTVTSVASGSGLTGGPVTTTGTLSVLANSGIIANTTGVFVNATYIGTISSNNANFLGTVAAASYVKNTDSRALSGNLTFTGTNTSISAEFRVVNSSANVFLATANGNIGIGNTTPAVKLEVAGSGRFGGSVTISNTGGTYQVGSIYGDADYGMRFRAAQANPLTSIFSWEDSNNSNLMRIDTLGNVGIGGSALSSKLGVNGSTYITGGLGVGTAPGTTGEIRATNDITAYYASDRNFKTNIVPIENALDKLRSITGVMFDWKDDYIEKKGGEDGYFVRKHDTGIIAQDVEAVLPEVVATKEDGSKAVKYEKMMGLVIQAINELADQVDEIKKKML